MRIATPILVTTLHACEVATTPATSEPHREDTASFVPGPHALEERICFALADRCDVACSAETFAELEALDGPIEARTMAELDACFPMSVCSDFRACVDRWIALRR